MGYFDGESWTVYYTANYDLPHNHVLALALDNQGTLWVGTDGGLARWDGTSWQVYNQGNSGLPRNSVYAIAIDEQGAKWIGAYGGGLARFDGSTWDVFNADNSGLPHDNVYAIAIDAQGNKWIGTAVHVSGPTGGGLAMFDGRDWAVYNRGNSALPHNDVYAVAIGPDGSVCTGSGEHVPTSVGGPARFDGVNWTVYDKQNSSIPYNLVYALAIAGDGTIWTGSINLDEVGGLVACRAVPVVDFNGDEIVDIKDLLRLIESWDQDDPAVDIGPTPFGDGIVDAADLEVLMSYWGQEIPNPALVARWKFDETEGDIAHDSTGTYDATLFNGPAWQPTGGQLDGALELRRLGRFRSDRVHCQPIRRAVQCLCPGQRWCAGAGDRFAGGRRGLADGGGSGRHIDDGTERLRPDRQAAGIGCGRHRWRMAPRGIHLGRRKPRSLRG